MPTVLTVTVLVVNDADTAAIAEDEPQCEIVSLLQGDDASCVVTSYVQLGDTPAGTAAKVLNSPTASGRTSAKTPSFFAAADTPDVAGMYRT